MGSRATAQKRLERILLLLPEAAREGGVPIDEMGRALGVDVEDLVDDLREVEDREYYLPASEGGQIQVTISPHRVHVWTSGAFRRPVRLNAGEALALVIGLRDLVLSNDVDREAHGDLIHRLAADLGRSDVEALPADGIGVDFGSTVDEKVRATLEAAARDRQRCRLRYLKPLASEPEERVVEPYALVYAATDAAWYVLGRSLERDAVRTFRLDRVLDAVELDESFEAPPDFDPAEYLTEGRLFRADEPVDAVVRYSPRIARWIEEERECERLPDGSVLVRHTVADPDWLVRHVLLHAPEAEVVEPGDLREAVRMGVEGGAARLAAAAGPR